MSEAPVLVDGGVTPYDPARIVSGNVATESGVNGVWMRNPVFADGSRLFGPAGLGLGDLELPVRRVRVPGGERAS